MNIAVKLEYFREDRQQLRDALIKANSIFAEYRKLIYTIPNCSEELTIKRWLENAKIKAIIILSGGGNVNNPLLVIMLNVCSLIAIDKGIPLIGICRGMQAIILHFGGSLKAKVVTLEQDIKCYSKIGKLK